VLPQIIAELARDPAFAAFASPEAILLVWDREARQVVTASPAATGLRKAVAGPDGRIDPNRPAAMRLRQLAGGLAPAAGLRLERLRLDPLAPAVTCACRRVDLGTEGTFFVTAIVGPLPRSSARSDPETEVPSPAPPQTPPSMVPPLADHARADADPRGRGTVRFLWQADAEARFTRVSPELAEIVGPTAADIVGQSWDDVAGSVVEDPAGTIASFFARELTWSGRSLLWSVDNSAWRIPVDWAGMPVYGPGRRLTGFRGFGLLRTDAAFERGAAERASEPAGPSATVQAADLTPSSLGADSGNRGRGWFTEARDKVAARLGARPAEEQAPNAARNPVAPEKPRPAEPLPRLSTAERSAFREIAKALGARFEPDDEPLPRSGEPIPEEAPLAAGEPAPSRLTVPEGEPAITADDPASSSPIPPEGEAAIAASTDEAAPASATLGTGAVLDRLPLGALVHRDERVLFANRKMLDLAGYESVAELAAEGGVGRLLGGSLPLAATGGLTSLVLATRQGGLPVEAQVATIDWDGAPAGLVLLRQTAAADLAARLESTERELALRDTRLADLEAMLRERDADLRDLEAGMRERDAHLRDLEVQAAERESRLRDHDAEAVQRSARVRELEGILDTATDGVIVTDETGRILSLNRSAEALFGYDAADVVGDAITVLLAPESHIVALDYLDRLRSSGMARALNDGREVTGRVRQGGAIPLFMAMGPLQDGPAPRVCAVLRDITAFKKAEAELVAAKRAAESANAQKSDVLAKISHEIRTPLNAIIGFAEVMLEERFGPVGNERYKEYLGDVHASGTHVISLVNDLLDLAKIEAGRMDLSFTGVGLNELVLACVSLLQPQAARERIVMRTSFAQRLPAVVADERSLRQIVLNLVSNAIKFTDAGGQVIVSTALTDRGEVAFRVRDTGIGMNEAEIAAALEPFRQITTTRRRGGTGLGLPLTKALVEANRGGMQITSAPREGTLVEVVLPTTQVGAD
jgi:PAS domain S-box-containing protein